MLPHNWRQLVTANVICILDIIVHAFTDVHAVKKTVPNIRVTVTTAIVNVNMEALPGPHEM